MNLLLDTTIRISILLSFALAAAMAARRASAAVRHRILAAAIVGAMATPLLALVVPSWQTGLGSPWSATRVDPGTDSLQPLELSSAAPPITAPNRAGGIAGFDVIRRLLVPVWLVGAAVSFLMLLVGLARLAWLETRAEYVLDRDWTGAAEDIALEYGLDRPARLLQSNHPTLLATWGLIRPRVIVPRAATTWSEDRIRIVLCHELAHVRRRDWIPQLTAELLRSIHWFNPLVWITCRRLRNESEYACDDLVLGAGVERATYATELLNLARAAAHHGTSWSPALAIARPSSLEGRIRAMLNNRLNRKPLTRSTSFFISLACLAIAVPVAGFATTGSSTTTAAVATRPSVTPPIKVVRLNVLERGDHEVLRAQLDPTVGVVAGTTLIQGAFASFSGTIVDPSGGLLPGVTLSLVNGQTRAKQEVRSDRRGRFEFVGLPAGSYALEVLLPGFATVHEGVTFSPGQVAEQNLTLQVGSIQETVMVTDRDAYPPDYGTQRREIEDRLGTLTARTRGQAGGSTCSAPIGGGIGGNLKPPTRVNNIRPVYPPAARDGKIEGTVVLQGRIDTSGFVTDVRVQGSPQADLAAAATDAVRGWRFDATLLNCVPIDTNMAVIVNFQLAR